MDSSLLTPNPVFILLCQKNDHLLALFTYQEAGGGGGEVSPHHSRLSRGELRFWICIASSSRPPNLIPANSAMPYPPPTKQRFRPSRGSPECTKRRHHFSSGPSEVQGHGVHPVEPQATVLMRTCTHSGSPKWGHGQCFYWQADPKLIRRPPHCLPEYKRHSVQKVQEEKLKSQDSSCSLIPQRNQRHPQCSLRPRNRYEI